MPTRIEYRVANGELVPLPAVPTVVGPFKTQVQARKAGERDWNDHPDVRWIVVPILTYYDDKDQLGSLPYFRLLDPTLRKRCGACKQTIKEVTDAA